MEPEALSTNEIYIQGVSTSLPADVQNELYASIKGLENAEIMRNAYAIEYDCIDSLELKPSLESKKLTGFSLLARLTEQAVMRKRQPKGLLRELTPQEKLT